MLSIVLSFFEGLIPAHAGKTALAPMRPRRSAAHPRSRGENASQVRRWLEAKGSSPLTRGKRPRGDRRQRRAGLIPAHAGKTTRTAHLVGARRAHPRSRGENHSNGSPRGRETGSSPLTRGKLPTGHRANPHQRLIPAHAGKTEIPNAQRRVSRAHPRSRGENPEGRRRRPRTTGSSPLTRGKRAQ